MSRVQVPSIALVSYLMSPIEALILGIIQGITEFFPVSSSGHLALGQHLLGMTKLDHYIFFNLICHLGTLLALIIVFFQEIKELFSKDRKKVWYLFLGTLPLFPLVLVMKPIKNIFDQPQYLGFCFLFTALLLYLGVRIGGKSEVIGYRKPKWYDALFVGCFQAVAILPGVSRSGSTISAGKFLRWQPSEAVTFSFLLAIPAILGGITLETWQLLKGEQSLPVSISGFSYVIGFFASSIVGYIALRMLIKVAAKEKFSYFVWYCLAIGLFSIFYFYL